MTPAGVVITLALFVATFCLGWGAGGAVADWRDRRAARRHSDAVRFLVMAAAMRRMSTPEPHPSRIAGMRRMNGGGK